MIIPSTCRAARALLGWSQQRLAEAARVGVGVVKNFEAGHTMPTTNNLGALQRALEEGGPEEGGIVFVSQEDGGPGILARRLRLRAYIPDEGLFFEVRYADLLQETDNDFELFFRLPSESLALIAGGPIGDEASAKAAARKGERWILTAAKQYIARHDLSSPGGRARVLDAKKMERAMRSPLD